MVERITSSTRYNQLIEDMKINQYNFYKLTAQLGSSSKLQNITDDPIASINVLNTNRQLNQMDVFKTNVGMASAELGALDDLLDLANGYLSTAWDKALAANNQTYGKSSLQAIKSEVDEITKTMVDLGNTQYNNNYIFSGANTKTAAYEIDDNGNVIYNGTPSSNPDHIRTTEVASGVFEVINTTGDKVFGFYEKREVTRDAAGTEVIKNDDGTYSYLDGTAYAGDTADLTTAVEEKAEGVMGALKILSNSIQMVIDGDSTNGYKLMNSTLDMFKDSQDVLLREQTKFGGVANRLEMTETTIETNSDSLTEYLQNVNGIDYAEAITNWLNAQYAYQASMQVSAATMNMSLLNYI